MIERIETKPVLTEYQTRVKPVVSKLEAITEPAELNRENVVKVNQQEKGSSQAEFALDIDNNAFVSLLAELGPVSNQEITPQNQLQIYLNLTLQALNNPEKKTSLMETAKDVLANYQLLKSETNIAELSELENALFKTDSQGQALIGEIDSQKLTNWLGIQKSVNLMEKANQNQDLAAALNTKIAEAKSPLQKQVWQLEQNLHQLQAQINLESALGKSEADPEIQKLGQVRNEIRLAHAQAKMAALLEKLPQSPELISDLQSLTGEWFVKADPETAAQAKFSLAQAEVLQGNFDRAQNIYQEIKQNFPAKALQAQISLTSLAKKQGLFQKPEKLKLQLQQIKQIESDISQLQNDLDSSLHRAFTSDKELQNEAQKLASLKNNLANLPGEAELRQELQVVEQKQSQLLQDLESNYQDNLQYVDNKQDLWLNKQLTKASILEKQANFSQAASLYNEVASIAEPAEFKADLKLKVAANQMAAENYSQALKTVRNLQNQSKSKPLIQSRAFITEAQILLAQGESESAGKAYKKVLQTLKGNNEPGANDVKNTTKVELAKLLYAQKDFATADKLIASAAQQDKFRLTALFAKGEAYLQNDRPRESFQAFDQILSTAPDSQPAQIIRSQLEDFMVNGRLRAGKVDTKSETWAAAQVALRASAGNSVYTSLALAAGGAAAGAAIGAGIGVWVGGAGAVPGALIGLAVGTVTDRASALINNWDSVEQTYQTGYENVGTLENTVNLVGLGLDFIDVIPVAGALGKVGSTAVRQGVKSGSKSAGTAITDDIISKTAQETLQKSGKDFSGTMVKARELTREFMETVNQQGKIFTDPKYAKAQLALGGGMMLTPGTIQVASALKDYQSGKINPDELQEQLLSAGENTLKAAASVMVMGLVMGKVQNMSSRLDQMTKGMAKEMSAPQAIKSKAKNTTATGKLTSGIKLSVNTTPAEMKQNIMVTLKAMAKQSGSLYSGHKLSTLKEVAQGISNGKIAVETDKSLVSFAKIRNQNGQISFVYNPQKFDPEFVDQTMVAHELIHIIQPMNKMPDNLKEGFTEYLSRELFPRKSAPELNYDKFVKATDSLLEGLIKRGTGQGIMGKFLGAEYEKVTYQELKNNPGLKKEMKVKLAQTLMEWNQQKFTDRLYSWFGLEIEDLGKTFDNLTTRVNK